ncbi:MAG: hypothetical protein AVDCRST_MAG17-1425 [uncultured Solirubrobacterales bacterium]|uniref:Uncharacterized protein n=1 Tax=uncultured Solirubrobacterales bacterium TaxID=768556 RepID=A0A6J4SKN2_9ACTN|nr:MAG: hypothetical protein AVDCRST_MAG17-1425 [uncultured Solirubrobacterales bacterium]
MAEARGSLTVPDLLGDLAGPPRRLARPPGSRERVPHGVAAAGCEALPAEVTEFRIELPAVETPPG